MHDIADNSDVPKTVPPHILCRQFLLAGMTSGMKVLDVGCGDGALMRELIGRGCLIRGIEIDPSLVGRCQAAGLRVSQGRAEQMPVPDASLDAIVCSVVLPYTDEKLVVVEWARVLKPGGIVSATFHGIGYGLDLLFRKRGWRRRLYGLRMLSNTFVYGFANRRLPGALGDTLCQTPRRMASYYRACGLRLEQEQVVGLVMGAPRFLCHRVIKAAESSSPNDPRQHGRLTVPPGP